MLHRHGCMAHVQDHGPDPPADRTWASQWNLDGEVAAWGEAWDRPELLPPSAVAPLLRHRGGLR